ncbi:MAG: hypothetical protein ACOYKM_08820 [Caulobacterales bacterium]|jgi:hypothetical protein
MRLFARRRLTPAEVALAQSVFAEQITYSKVRVFQGPTLGFGAMVPAGTTIVFSRWRAPLDFAKTEPTEQGWFIHELAHVWQAARGVILAGAKLSALGAKAYRYSLKPGDRLADFNIEQQAEIARGVFHARLGQKAPGHPAPDLLEAVWPVPNAKAAPAALKPGPVAPGT